MLRARPFLSGLILSVAAAVTSPHGVAATTPAAVPAQSTLLAEARRLLGTGDFGGAEQRALEAVAAHPETGSAYLVLGLARYRAARYAAALEAFASARAAADPAPAGPIAFNEGAALLALGRPEQAERAYVVASRSDPKLEVVGRVNAGHAAVAAGALDRARAHAAAARVAMGPLAAAFDRGSTEAGTDKGLGELDAAIAEAHYEGALEDLRRDDPEAARTKFRQTLVLAPDPDLAATVDEHLDALGFGLRGGGGGPSVRIDLGGGYESNVAQLGLVRAEVIEAETPETRDGVFGTIAVDALYAWLPGRRGYAEVSYLLDQVGYGDEAFDAYSLQAHALGARGEYALSDAWRVGVAGGVDWQFVGLRGFTAFERLLTFEPHVAFDESARTSTSLRVRWQSKHALAAEARPFAGGRLDLRLGQRWRLGRFRGEVAYRHRRENIGGREEDLGMLSARLAGRYSVPYSYRSHAGLLDASLALGPVRIRLGASLERIGYRDDTVLFAQGTGQLGLTREIRRVRRHDQRVGLSPAVGVVLGRSFEASLRYDVVDNGSNVDFAFDDKSFTKHMVSLELSLDL